MGFFDVLGTADMQVQDGKMAVLTGKMMGVDTPFGYTDI